MRFVYALQAQIWKKGESDHIWIMQWYNGWLVIYSGMNKNDDR